LGLELSLGSPRRPRQITASTPAIGAAIMIPFAGRATGRAGFRLARWTAHHPADDA
jgi:hypothetical protein